MHDAKVLQSLRNSKYFIKISSKLDHCLHDTRFDLKTDSDEGERITFKHTVMSIRNSDYLSFCLHVCNQAQSHLNTKNTEAILICFGVWLRWSEFTLLHRSLSWASRHPLYFGGINFSPRHKKNTEAILIYFGVWLRWSEFTLLHRSLSWARTRDPMINSHVL